MTRKEDILRPGAADAPNPRYLIHQLLRRVPKNFDAGCMGGWMPSDAIRKTTAGAIQDRAVACWCSRLC